MYLTRSAMCGLAAYKHVAVSSKDHIHIHRFIKLPFWGLQSYELVSKIQRKMEIILAIRRNSCNFAHYLYMDNKQATLELGTKPVGQLLVQYALPAIVAMTASSLYNIIDRAFIG